MMNLAILHYHLDRGGVTQVIVNHLRALGGANDGGTAVHRVALLYGGSAAGWSEPGLGALPGIEVTRRVVPGLGYDSDPRAAEPERLAGSIRQALQPLAFAPSDTLLHVHNHALGKNVSLPGALGCLARDGYALLLQIHDFAEDFRPENYRRLLAALAGGNPDLLAGLLYPQAPQVHYAVLNQRDCSVLRSAGVAEQRLHWLPNPIAGFGQLPARRDARAKLATACPGLSPARLVLYPVRGIRRKNLGEMLLWSLLAPEGTRFGITQAPSNPSEYQAYAGWKRLAEEWALPCLFELGQVPGVTFADNLAAADAVITTSVAEGFGLVFLESWLAGRTLIGRDLPEVTADYVAAGLNLDDLYSRMAIPLNWIGWRDLVQALRPCYEAVLVAFGRPPLQPGEFEAQLQQVVADGPVDFALLPTGLQRRVLHRLREQPSDIETLRAMNPAVPRSLARIADDSLRIRSNAAAVEAGYSLPAAGRRLQEVYAVCLNSPRGGQVEPPAQGPAVLSSFLHLSRFQPLRVEAV